MLRSLFFVDNYKIPNHNVFFECEEIKNLNPEIALYEPIMKIVHYNYVDGKDGLRRCVRIIIVMKLFKVLKHKWKK